MNATSIVSDAGAGNSNGKPWSVRGLVIVSSLTSAFLTSGLALGVQYYSSLWQQQRAERVTEVSGFVAAANQFDQLVTGFMDKFLVGADTTTERQSLHANLQQQYNLLDTAKTNLDPRQVRRAEHYQAILSGVGRELDRGLPAADAQRLVQAIADARAANVCVVADLRDRAGLPVTSSDRVACETTLPSSPPT